MDVHQAAQPGLDHIAGLTIPKAFHQSAEGEDDGQGGDVFAREK